MVRLLVRRGFINEDRIAKIAKLIPTYQYGASSVVERPDRLTIPRNSVPVVTIAIAEFHKLRLILDKYGRTLSKITSIIPPTRGTANK